MISSGVMRRGSPVASLGLIHLNLLILKPFCYLLLQGKDLKTVRSTGSVLLNWSR